MRLTIMILGILGCIATTTAQQYRFVTLTAGTNAIDDIGLGTFPSFSDLNYKNPFLFSAEGRFNKSLSVSLSGTSNEVDLEADQSRRFYIGIDAMLNFYIDQYLWNNDDVEWYFSAGTGIYSLKGLIDKGSMNGATGFRFWISDQVGFNIQTMAKFAMNRTSALRNHYVHSVGLVWGLKTKPKPEPESEPESILEPAPKEIPEPVVVTPLVVEEPEEVEPQADLPLLVSSVYFDRNSSFFGRGEEVKLDELVLKMLSEPELRLEVDSYTDSTGEEAYNLWLANNRLERTIEYLVQRGVDRNRIQGEAKGIDPASLPCKDQNNNCTEESQRVYRRAEFRVFRQ
ncbi:OmpA family protein [Aureitalea marina]|uniref:OmpA-like domain-containing protein n=1 Tax=Aureitalea marina TaxID=930804 RepID=A0A2S7KPJ3_9FLAO|nr:OmpA family protein [Aureitalea marina]PQB04542.1 hypothetical protein BST85_06235 [Aureitalea marina]